MPLQSERERVAHILRRFGLGASEAEVEFYAARGWKATIDLLLNPDQVDEPELPPAEAFGGKQGLKPQNVRAWWIQKLLSTRRPLLEALTLFWHDHFATSVQKVDNAGLMLDQNATLRQFALGSFRDLLREVSKDPAMMFWLDNQLNVKGKPNENFAREVMELFTLGIGYYSEQDIQEAARAFTGWNYSERRNRRANPNSIRGGRPVFVFVQDDHDAGVKTVLGRSGPLNGDDVLDLLCDHPQTARHLVTKLWTWFVYPEPEAKVIDRHADVFRRADLNVKALLRSILESDEFYSSKAERAIYKHPIHFTVSTLRAMGVVEPPKTQDGEVVGASARAIVAVAQASKAMGMELLAPPDVAGWEGGSAWITTATMVERIRWADRLFAAPTRAASGQGGKGKVPTLGLPAAPLFDSGDPMAAARKLASVFDAPLPSEKLVTIANAIRQGVGGEVDASNANAAANLAARMIFGSPEFQFC